MIPSGYPPPFPPPLPSLETLSQKDSVIKSDKFIQDAYRTLWAILYNVKHIKVGDEPATSLKYKIIRDVSQTCDFLLQRTPDISNFQSGDVIVIAFSVEEANHIITTTNTLIDRTFKLLAMKNTTIVE